MKAKILEYGHRFKQFLLSKKTASVVPASLPPEYNIQEILPINCRESDIMETRFNLLIPALSLRFSFGGINTALDFFSALIGNAANARIIITDEAVSDLQGFAQSADWQLVSSEHDDVYGRSIVCFGDRYNKTIPVRKNDVFVATAWWTSYNGERILNWQKEKWGEEPSSLVFLIQDFEPGFYKWSSRYMLALSTYNQKNMIAVINTALLYDFIKNNDISFKHYFIFEPVINKKLATYIDQKPAHLKKKKIIFYGRPSVERNAYEIIAKGLELWSFWYPGANNWEVISLGEAYPNIKLGNNIEVNVKGKVAIDEYANILLDASIGISLMVSPHPSYPPLEMAAFDLAVITNKFSNKNLSDYHDNIFSLENISPENIAHLISDLCGQFEENNNCFSNRNFRNINFLNSNQGFDFVDDLKGYLPTLL
jgi:beta-1,2-rhamnosyltransferase WsaF-like protein